MNTYLKHLHSWIPTPAVGVLYAIALAASLGQLARIPLAGTAVYLHELLTMTWIVWVGAKHISHLKQLRLPHVKPSPIALLLVGILALGWLLSGYQDPSLVTRPLLYSGRLAMYGVFAWLMAHETSVRRSHLEYSWVLVTGLLVWWGLLQIVIIPDTRFLAILGWDDHYYRLISTLFDPNYTGLLIGLGLLVAATTEWTSQRIKTACMVIFTIALALTFSRSAWVATSIGAVWLFISSTLSFKQISKGITLGILVSALVIMYAQFNPTEGTRLLRTSSIRARLTTQQQYLSQLDQPHEGMIGQGLFVNEQERVYKSSVWERPNTAVIPDAWPVTILLGMGVLGLLLVLTVSGRWWLEQRPPIQSLVLAVGLFGLVNNVMTTAICLVAISWITILAKKSRV